MNSFKNPLLKSMKIGFVGAGHMTQALVKGMVQSKAVRPEQIIISNRTPGKLIKLQETFGVQTRAQNEQVVEECDVVILAMKPQDLPAAIESIAGAFNEHQIVISLAAGITFSILEKQVSDGRLVRLMPNTPSLISRGILGFMCQESDDYVSSTMEDLFSSLGVVVEVDLEEKLDALMISCSSGTGFVFEMMMYWQDWIAERGFTDEEARLMTIETFLGASMLAAQSDGIEIEELQSRVTSKKGVTAAGLSSMRELEMERVLRLSFEKANMRAQEISRSTK
ncbi:MAG: pyrroline-5-carboxylate reductase [Bdellovibrio sp.]|nr:pyrroline-5-carboxylate reductase [Bdellovibrio sp.]